MAKRERLEIRFSQTFHVTLAAIGIMLPIAAVIWLLASPDKMEGGRLLWLGLCAAGLLYYTGRAIVRLRKQDKDERAEQEAILETYLQALGMLL